MLRTICKIFAALGRKLVAARALVFGQKVAGRSLGLMVVALVLVAASCGGPRKGGNAPKAKAFPNVSVPGIYTSEQDRFSYATTHYWDAFLALDGPTDSAHILGVKRADVEQALSNYISLLQMAPLSEGQKCVDGLFKGVCKAQGRDSLGHFYMQFTQMVASYLYDPNSPCRDEDLYLPFVQGLANSPFTRDDLRRAYKYEASCCAINPRGSIAPNFSARRLDGSTFTLHSIKAPFTLLFFSNPGCHSCKEIIDQINMEFGSLVSSGELAVVNVYIDESLDEWNNYAHKYPTTWHNGYDYRYVIRGERLYDVRAIPSLYLLDASKRILLKDAPFERLVGVLSSNLQ